VLILPIRPTIQGTCIVLCFKCVDALLNPDNRTGGNIRWELVAHTVAMFSFFAKPVAAHISKQSIFYIDNRGFPGDDVYPPGPLGYQHLTDLKAVNDFPRIMFPLNRWPFGRLYFKLSRLGI
jgi:hypothetical protein